MSTKLACPTEPDSVEHLLQEFHKRQAGVVEAPVSPDSEPTKPYPANDVGPKAFTDVFSSDADVEEGRSGKAHERSGKYTKEARAASKVRGQARAKAKLRGENIGRGFVTITVKTLISLLADFPADASVLLLDVEGDFSPLGSVALRQRADLYLSDSAGPQISRVVVTLLPEE